MNPSGYVKVTMSVLMAAIVVISVLVPVVYGASTTTVTITNEGAGWAKFAYNDEATDYNIAMSAYGSNLTLGDQTGAADEMIVYASAVFSILYADDSFKLVAPSGASADLGSSAAVASSSGTVTVTDANSTPVYGTDAVTWSYVPDVDGSFGFYTETGKTVKDFPVAAAGSFAGAYAYNEINSLNHATMAPTYSVTGDVFNTGPWTVPDLGAKVVKPTLEEKTELKIEQKTAIKAVTPSYTDGDWGFNLSGNAATIVSYSGAAGSIAIPSTVSSGGQTYTVTALGTGNIGEPIFTNSNISGSTLTIPNTVTNIKSNAFRACSGFTGSLVIPDSVTTIGTQAFDTCSGFTSLALPDSMSSLGGYAFANCTGFTGPLTIPDSITSIGASTFMDCSGFTGSLVIPDSITSIGQNAFYRCSGFTGSLVIPDSITSIADSAFYRCSGFTGSLVIPDSVTTVGANAFNGCTGLTGVIVLGSPSFGSTSLNLSNVDEVLNLGNTAISPGNYGISADAVVSDEIPSLGYIAPASFSETVQNTGLVYTIMSYLPVLIIVGLMVGVLGVFVSNRRA